jgi:LysM repeat protein
MPDSVGIRYSPTRPGTTVATALESQPVSDVTPATTYTVGPGDTLSGVAKKNQLTKAEIASANNLRAGSVLRVGQKLIIPARGRPASAAAPVAPAQEPQAQAAADKAPADGTRHVVKAGETLGGIARRYGVKQGDIAVANNITDPRRIHPGQELVIPSKSPAGAKASRTSAAKAQPAAPAPPPSDQDLDAGLKSAPTDVPSVKIDDGSGLQPKNP